MQRIIIVGTPCSGKTTLARRLAEKRGCHHIEVDALLFGPHWLLTPSQQVRDKVQALISQDEWVFDGNAIVVRDLVWEAGDTVIWLDYPLLLILWRAFWRTIWRLIHYEELWNGNREHLRHHLGKHSIFVVVIRDWRQRHHKYLEPLASHSHLHVVQLCSVRETQAWIQQYL